MGYYFVYCNYYGFNFRQTLNLNQNAKFLDWSKLKAFADNKIFDLKAEVLFGMGFLHFLLCP